MTLTFRVFLKRLLYAALAAIVAVLVIITSRVLDYRSQQSDLQSKIDFYERFVHADDFLAHDGINDKDTGVFRAFIYSVRHHVSATVEDPALQLDSLLRLNRDYGTVFEEIRKTINNDPELLRTLLFDQTQTYALIEAEKKKKEGLAASLNLYPEWRFAFKVFQGGSVVLLILAWMVEGNYSIFFFPLRAWWLYGYLALAFPMSLVLVGLTLATETTIFLVKAASAEAEKFGSACENLKRRFRREASYDEMCAKIRTTREKQRTTWVVSFSGKRIRRRIEQENKHLATVKQTLVETGERLREMQKEYFDGRAKIEQLERLSEAHNRIGEEFDELYANPHVKALEINEGEEILIVHTGTFSSRLGLVGPFRIEISMPGKEKVQVYPATEFTRAHPTGGGGKMHNGYFCFGNTSDLIRKLTHELRFAEAVGVMFQAFQG